MGCTGEGSLAGGGVGTSAVAALPTPAAVGKAGSPTLGATEADDIAAGDAAAVSAAGERGGGDAHPVSPDEAGGAPPTIIAVATKAYG